MLLQNTLETYVLSNNYYRCQYKSLNEFAKEYRSLELYMHISAFKYRNQGTPSVEIRYDMSPAL